MENMVASLALHAVLEPVFSELEVDEKNIAAVQTLRTAFTKAERAHPGLTQEFISGVLDAEGVDLNLPEALLRLACYDVSQYTITSHDEEFVQLNYRAKGKDDVVMYPDDCTIALKEKLSRIPDQIRDRSTFLRIIRDVASSIKEVLDAVNEVSKRHQADPSMKEHRKVLDSRKRVFVKSSRSFSDTLKRYFRDGRSEHVFLSANRLINHTNALLSTYKLLGY